MKTKTCINWIVVIVLLVALLGVAPYTQLIAKAATIVRVKPGGFWQFSSLFWQFKEK